MCPRRRSISDNDIILAAARVVALRGEETRLADVASAIGLAPATLIQRFGTREALMEAVGGSFIVELQQLFPTSQDPLTGLVTALFALPFARHLAFFALRPGQGGRYSLELRKQIAFALAAAVEAGTLAPCDVADLARRLEVAFFGHATAAWLEGSAFDRASVAALVELHIDDYR